MPSNPAGRGTATIGINFTVGELEILKRLAIEEERSMGKFIRHCIVTHLRINNPKAADEFAASRLEHNRKNYDRRAIS